MFPTDKDGQRRPVYDGTSLDQVGSVAQLGDRSAPSAGRWGWNLYSESSQSGGDFDPMKTCLTWMKVFLFGLGMTSFVRAEAGPWLNELSVQAGAAIPTQVNHLSDSQAVGPTAGIR